MSMTTKEQFEQAIKARFGDSIDYRVCKNSDGEYMAWDMQVAWWAWQAASKASEQQLSESRRKFTAANANIHNLELKVAQVVAENAGLKNAMGVTLEHVSVMDTGQAGVAAMIINDALHHSETPATDTAIANIQAQGVEMYAEATIAIGEEEQSEDIVYAGKQALLFAAQLRQGAGQ